MQDQPISIKVTLLEIVEWENQVLSPDTKQAHLKKIIYQQMVQVIPKKC